MALARYSKFIFDACKNSRIGVRRNPIQEPITQTAFSWKPSTNSEPILRNSELQKKYYFKNRGWFHNPKRVGAAIFLFGCGFAIAVASGDWVTVPYSGRNHFIIFHGFMKKFLPEEHTSFVGEETLPPLDPLTVLIQTILEDIIHQALPLETEIKRQIELQNEVKIITIPGFDGSKFEVISSKNQGDDEEKKAKECELIVFNSDEVIAKTSGRFGKIYVSTEFIYNFRNSVAKIASIFGHEVGNDLARHYEEKISKFISLVSVLGIGVYLFWQSTYFRSQMPYLDTLMRRRFLSSLSFVASVALLSYLPMMHYLREIDYEADYIGLMLAASAGYNPVEGLMWPVHEGPSSPVHLMFPELFCPRPTPEKRSIRLLQPIILGEAFARFLLSKKSADKKPADDDQA